MPNLSNLDLSSFVIYLPTIEKQKEICELINSLSSQIDAVISAYKQKLRSLEELKQSLLNKAFSGELTTIKDDELRTEEVA